MSRRGFTLIEITVVVALIALFASLIVPNLASEKAGRERRAFYVNLENLVVDARETAIETKRTVNLRYDDSAEEFYLNQELEDDAEGTEQEIGKRIHLAEGMRTSEFRADDQTASSGDWSIAFYSDGTSDGGGVAIMDGERQFAFVVNDRGGYEAVDGGLPDPTENKWPAGENEHRA
jgi:prepilin-type N-terminal cleavage/methylation domain-containing protein